MATLNPYLNFSGNTEEAFNFYKSVFGGEFLGLHRFKEMPEMPVPEKFQDMVMHVSLPIGKNLLMGTDGLEEMGQGIKPGNNISLQLEAESQEEATKLFNALAVGGSVVMPLENAPWGAFYGMLVDKFGIQWMVNYAFK